MNRIRGEPLPISQFKGESDKRIKFSIQHWLNIWAIPDFQFPLAGAGSSLDSSNFRKNDSPSTISIDEVQVKDITFDSTTITWITNKFASSQAWVKLASGPVDWKMAGESVSARPIATEGALEDLTQNHSLTVTNLQPSTTYYYHIASMDEDGQVSVTDERSFTTVSGGSVVTFLKNLFRPAYHQVKCFYIPNRTPIFIIGGVFLLGLAYASWRLLHSRQFKNG